MSKVLEALEHIYYGSQGYGETDKYYKYLKEYLEAIDNSKPSEAIECLEKVSNKLNLRNDEYNPIEEDLITIKEALTTKSKKELAFEIMNKKNVNTYLLKNAMEIYDYNSYYVTNDERLTQDEFDLLMEVLWDE